MRVLVLTRYTRTGSSSRLRFLQFLPGLKSHGIEVDVRPLFRDGYLARRFGPRAVPPHWIAADYARRLGAVLGARRYDLVWLEGEVWPWLPGLVERLLPAMGVPYVVDYDDALFHRFDRSESFVVRGLLGSKIAGVMRRAAAVVVGNSYLGAYAREAGAATVVEIPTVLDPERYGTAAPRDPAVIGWIGSPSTAPYVSDIASDLDAACADTGARLRLIGFDRALAGAFAVPPDLRDWEEGREAADLADLTLGIMPLRATPFEQGKCGYKLIQYMAAGVPVLATDTAANRRIVESAGAGRIVPAAAPEGAWHAAIREMLADPEMLTRMGNSGRAAAARTYSLDAQTPVLAGVLTAAAQRPSMPERLA